MLPIILHVGLHKTGTTWLQQFLFQDNHKRRIIYCEDRAKVRGNFSVPKYSEFSVATVKEDLSDLLLQSEISGLPLVFSDEALMGFPYNAKFSRQVTMMRIRDSFPDARILVTVREQRRLIRSYYGHYIRGGGTASLIDFLAQPDGLEKRLYDPIVDLDFFDYTAMSKFLSELFGPDKVIIAPMEWMMGNTCEFIERLASKFGVSLDESIQPEKRSVVNPAWSPLAFECARYANHLAAGKPRWLQHTRFVQPNWLASVIDSYTPASVRANGLRRQTALIDAAIGDYFAPSNAALAASIGVDLKEYGYRLTDM